ncbi:hypothetical protein GTA08_BOTSDO12779 [Botryosphaeria dothidea]|uniref:Uncharacterized protein n=1 Tax=Botryosphaeria dothidea TaxID=55169 RepID=A0A8H4J1U7_9PEZI|nr:hypothetical protein GTA08_BOTSDO12779 [Botryosphaeria dothidea]
MPEETRGNGSSTTNTTTTKPPVDLSSLQGKGVLVTGGATGPGAALVRALADAGAYVTIADDNAIAGQRLMLDLINTNKRAQYTYTRLPSFPSQAESFHHASSFSPTTTLSLVVANVIPASPPPPSDPLLAWLTTADPAATPPPAPSTASLDVGVTAALYTAHLAFHHFRASAKNDDDDDEDAGRRGGHLLFLAPRAYVVDGGVGPDALAAGAAAAGFRSVVRALRAVTARKGKGGAAGVVEGVRVNLVAVEAEGGVAVQGREDRSTRGEEGTDEKERKDGNEEEVKL